MIRRRLVVTLALAAALCAAALAWVFARDDGQLHVYFLDVGQGDAIYIRAPGGKDMLIDAGIGAVVLARLGEVMPWHDRSIDFVIATHPDADHIGGLPRVLSRYKVGLFVESGLGSRNAIDEEIRRLLAEKGIRLAVARRGMVIDLGGDARFEVLFPDRDPKGMKTNDASIVGILRHGDVAFMLTGDSPSSVEKHIVSMAATGTADLPGLKSDVLKAGHHGSKTSSSEAFVRAVDPRWAVVSAGCKNRYGHPHKDVIALFDRLGIEALGTCERGTIEFRSDGERAALEE